MNDVIETCAACGRKNRLPATLAPGKALRCGECKAPLDGDIGGTGDGDDLDDEDEDDDLDEDEDA